MKINDLYEACSQSSKSAGLVNPHLSIVSTAGANVAHDLSSAQLEASRASVLDILKTHAAWDLRRGPVSAKYATRC